MKQGQWSSVGGRLHSPVYRAFRASDNRPAVYGGSWEVRNAALSLVYGASRSSASATHRTAEADPARSPLNGARDRRDDPLTRRKRRACDRYAEKGRKRPYSQNLGLPVRSEVALSYYWSVRVRRNYRVVARKHEDTMIWFWIGTHGEFDKRFPA